jgi:hypothetical protein
MDDIPVAQRAALAIIWLISIASVVLIHGLGIYSHVFQEHIPHKADTLAGILKIIHAWSFLSLPFLFLLFVGPKLPGIFDKQA